MAAKPIHYVCNACGGRKEIKFPIKNQKMFCDECAAQMEEVEEAPVVVNQRFLDARQKVDDKIKEKSLAGSAVVYQKAVMEHLLGCPAFFQNDFVSEMNKASELSKFLGLSKRPTNADKVCVDNALTSVGYAFPSTLPRGEKFTFEVPYILEAAKWTFVNGPTDIFVSNFTALAGVVEAGTMYLVVVKRSNNPIGHMIVLTTDAGNRAYVTDLQKQVNSYNSYEYVAWKYGEAPSSRPKPYREIDLSTAAWKGEWQS